MPDAPSNPPFETFALQARTTRRPRCDVYLHAHFPWRSRTQIQEMLARGEITINGRPSKPSYRIKRGDAIALSAPARPQPALGFAPGAIQVLYEDRHLVVMNKPSGILTHPTAGHQNDTLMNYVAAAYPHAPPLTCHRLDRETSGAILIVFDLLVRRRIQRQFERKLVVKECLALVAGAFPEGRREVRLPIRPATTLAAALGGDARKESLTILECLARGAEASLVRASPVTGRQNQIRIHCAALGHPLVGDTRYGGPECPPTTDHFLLHAARLCFHHPVLKLKAEITAPPPADFLATLARYGLQGREA